MKACTRTVYGLTWLMRRHIRLYTVLVHGKTSPKCLPVETHARPSGERDEMLALACAQPTTVALFEALPRFGQQQLWMLHVSPICHWNLTHLRHCLLFVIFV